MPALSDVERKWTMEAGGSCVLSRRDSRIKALEDRFEDIYTTYEELIFYGCLVWAAITMLTLMIMGV